MWKPQRSRRRWIKVIGRRLIEGFELGNEPELYANRYFYTLNGVDVFARPPGWDFESYLRDYTYIASAMGHVPIAGPAVGVYSWISHLQQFLRVERPSVVTVHRYPLQSCSAVPGIVQLPNDLPPLGTDGIGWIGGWARAVRGDGPCAPPTSFGMRR